jgi:hypothetical protein
LSACGPAVFSIPCRLGSGNDLLEGARPCGRWRSRADSDREAGVVVAAWCFVSGPLCFGSGPLCFGSGPLCFGSGPLCFVSALRSALLRLESAGARHRAWRRLAAGEPGLVSVDVGPRPRHRPPRVPCAAHSFALKVLTPVSAPGTVLQQASRAWSALTAPPPASRALRSALLRLESADARHRAWRRLAAGESESVGAEQGVGDPRGSRRRCSLPSPGESKIAGGSLSACGPAVFSIPCRLGSGNDLLEGARPCGRWRPRADSDRERALSSLRGGVTAHHAVALEDLVVAGEELSLPLWWRHRTPCRCSRRTSR